jgi:photosystem II stability/assembly factor-like uncharacterized protein
MIRQAGLFLLSLSMAVALSAETPRWTRATPFGGRMVALTQSSSLPQTLYSATAEGRFYVSNNGGVTWRLRPAPIQAGETILDIVADPLNAQTLYLRTSSGLLRSQDGGVSWSRVGIGLPMIQAVAPDRSLPGVVWAATQRGLYRSNDEGDIWQLAGLDGWFLTALAIDPLAPGTFLVGVKGDPLYSPAAVWHSTDHGETWAGSLVPILQLGSYPGEPRFAFDAAHPGITYVFFVNGGYFETLLQTTDLGTTWTIVQPLASINDLASSPDGTLFAATDSGVSTSTDQGITWVPPLPLSAAAPPNDELVRILVSAALPSHLLAAGSAGIWTSRNSGASWQDSSRGIVAPNASPVFASPAGAPALTTAAGNSVYRSVDQGTTWTRLATRAGRYSVRLAALQPRRPRTMYRIDSDGRSEDLLKSTDGGRSWSPLSFPNTCGSPACHVTIVAVALDPRNPETIYVAGRSPGSFLVSGNDRLELLEGAPRFTGLTADPDRSGVLYGRSCRGLNKSFDAGVSWRKMGRNLPSNACATALALDPRDTRKMWLSLAGKGLFFSSNGGETFQSMSRGLESGQIGTLLFDPAVPSRVYAGVSGRGVYRWDPARRQWSRLPNPGLPAAGYTGILTLDPQNPSVLYASHPEHGIFRLELEE